MRRGIVRRTVAVVALLAALLPWAGPATGQATETPPTVLRIPFPRDDGSLTPYTFQLGYPLVNLVYDTLVWRDPTGVPKPWLARAVEPNADATRFTVRLNAGVRWHDGTPVTAEDVRFTFGYVATRPSPRFSAEVADVANVSVIDAETVVITTRRPSVGFVDQTLADLPILPAHLWRTLAPGTETPPGLAVGSGPYRLVERLTGGGYRFEANTGYFKGSPRVAQIEIPIVNDLGKTLAAFRGREIDMIPLRLPPDNVRAVDGLSATVARGPSYWGVQLVFNLRQAPFNNPALRQAVSQAVDLDRLVRTVGDAVPADRGLLHPDSAWAPSETLKTTDEAAARTALAGLTQGVDVVSADNDPVHLETARQVALALERAGVRATATQLPVAELGRALGAEGATPSFTLAVTTLSPAASYDPDYLARLFGSASATTSGYSSAAFDQVARRVATTVDPAARRAATAEELRLLATDLPVLPLLFPNGAFAYRPAVYDGWQYVKGIGLLDKQSFLPNQAGSQPAPTTSVAPTPSGPAPITPPSSSRLPALILPMGLAAAGLALLAVVVIRRRG